MTKRRLDLPKPQPPEVTHSDNNMPRRLDIDVSGFGNSEGSTDVLDPEVRSALEKVPAEPKSSSESSRPATKKPSNRSPRRTAAKTAGAANMAIRRKRNALLPHRLVPALRDRAVEDSIPHGEVVVDAFVNHIDAVREELAADQGDSERRKKLGLPARRRRQPRLGDDELERRVQVGLYMPNQAISVIESAAGELGISWSYLVSLVLDRELIAGTT